MWIAFIYLYLIHRTHIYKQKWSHRRPLLVQTARASTGPEPGCGAGQLSLGVGQGDAGDYGSAFSRGAFLSAEHTGPSPPLPLPPAQGP